MEKCCLLKMQHIFSRARTRLSFNIIVLECGSIGPVELQFEAEAGHEYIAKWHYSWSKSFYYFSIEDAQTGNYRSREDRNHAVNKIFAVVVFHQRTFFPSLTS